MKKKFFALYLSIAMLGAFCSCTLAGDGNQTEKDSETTYVESEIEDDSEIAASESELQLEKVYDSICKSIVKDYCEPNNIVPKDFVWPEKSSIAWMYFGDLATHHQMELMGLNTESEYMPSDSEKSLIDITEYMPSDSEKSLMDITFNSILEWIDTNPEENTAYYSSILQELTPYYENIPAKMTIADFCYAPYSMTLH